ncbi:beta-N-acetylhexosaminidase [Stakelama tenebrarum]|uniref:beta-N-acetylhexosaminidase n=1 Tax=Stakelama tenebrarum TaxID=2711215 RepID=A0A6G6Y4T4_9SPHN|nr:beta-N-acetylhexosaminidase [Sphingosinithalassobacter tenebrarum]QIG79817.1 beta-N-acetylhexosaminidase [Sphingosinithalassobacter tenebrarum]
MKPVIFGLSGHSLTADERDFFRDADPLGYILFRRNCGDRAQMRALTDSLRDLSGRDNLPILIDQEGGRVARMQPPEWPAFPAPAVFDKLYDIAPVSAIEAARANAHALALMLAEVGVNVDALPLLDIVRPETSTVIGDRSFGAEPMRVAALGRATIEGLRRGGVVGIVKHMPGHGRGVVDSHHELPVVKASEEELALDIEPFATLSDAPMGMTAHIVYTAWDGECPGTLSPRVIGEIIRQRIGFDGLLMSDDIDMKALSGTAGEKAAAAVAAGCDVALDCWARMDEMVEIAEKLGDVSSKTRERLERAMATLADKPEPGAFDDLIAKRDSLLALA